MRYGTEYIEECGQTEAPPPEGPMGEAQSALSSTYALHKQLDDLESRLFGPEPKAVGNDNQPASGRPALAHTLKHTRQRLDNVRFALRGKDGAYQLVRAFKCSSVVV